MKSHKSSPKPSARRPFVLRRVMGDSMLPTITPGGVVLGVWPRKIRRGDIVIIRHNGIDKIKRVQDISINKIFLVGDNPLASTDSRDFGWLETTVVIAKVVWF